MYIGQLRSAGLAKEDIVGTLKSPPSEFIPYIAPDSFFPSIKLLESTSIRALADRIYLASQGPGDIKGMKLKWQASGGNIGNLLMGVFGTDSPAETASFVVDSTNNKIDFKLSGGSQLHATIASATYIMGATSATVGSLLAAVKTALDAQGGGTTFTLSFNAGTRKITITPSTGTIQILWLTGTNNANGAYAILGFSKADTTDASSQTSDSTTAKPVYAHTFTRLQAAQLPTYSWWFDKGAKYEQFLGCMVSKNDLIIKAGEFVEVDTDWTGLSYDDNGTSESPSYDAMRPWKFDQCVVKVDGSQVNNYDNLKITFDNMVKADHALAGSIYAQKVYSEGFEITISMDLFVEDSTQYAKFLAGTSCALNFALTSADDISGAFAGAKSKLTLDIPTAYYSAAPYPNAQGILKIAFTARGVYNVANSKTIDAVLINSVSSAY